MADKTETIRNHVATTSALSFTMLTTDLQADGKAVLDTFDSKEREGVYVLYADTQDAVVSACLYRGIAETVLGTMGAASQYAQCRVDTMMDMINNVPDNTGVIVVLGVPFTITACNFLLKQAKRVIWYYQAIQPIDDISQEAEKNERLSLLMLRQRTAVETVWRSFQDITYGETKRWYDSLAWRVMYLARDTTSPRMNRLTSGETIADDFRKGSFAAWYALQIDPVTAVYDMIGPHVDDSRLFRAFTGGEALYNGFVATVSFMAEKTLSVVTWSYYGQKVRNVQVVIAITDVPALDVADVLFSRTALEAEAVVVVTLTDARKAKLKVFTTHECNAYQLVRHLSGKGFHEYAEAEVTLEILASLMQNNAVFSGLFLG